MKENMHSHSEFHYAHNIQGKRLVSVSPPTPQMNQPRRVVGEIILIQIRVLI